MELKENYTQKLARAQKRVDAIKKFYGHLKVYIIINIVILVVKFRALDFFGDHVIQDSGFNDWFVLNVFGTTIVWGIALLLHAVYVFKFDAKPWRELKPNTLKDWEDRQIQKFIDEENIEKD